MPDWLDQTHYDAHKTVANAQIEFDRNTTAVRTFGGVDQLIETARLLRNNELTDDVEHGLQHQLVFGVWRLWYYERRINIVYEGDDYPTQDGKKILELLSCSEADAFFDIATELLDSSSDWPELHDPTSDEYKELRDFVERSLARPNGG